jgi:hypothetical protein
MDHTLLTKPSAFLPLAMSAAALAVVGLHLALAGPAPQADEGLAAHLWQLLMAGQVPLVAWFTLQWGPRRPLGALRVVGLQGVAALAALAPVFLLHW